MTIVENKYAGPIWYEKFTKEIINYCNSFQFSPLYLNNYFIPGI